MEIEKAVEILEDSKQTYAELLPDVLSASLQTKTKNLIEAHELAIQALEKQAGKKPAEREYDDEFVCPSCRTYHEAYDVTVMKHCPVCGQKMDWGDE